MTTLGRTAAFRGVRMLSLVVCLGTPMYAIAQPGRTFTPPPPPPPPPPRPVYTPLPMPPRVVNQPTVAQTMQQMQREQINRDMLRTQQDARRVLDAARTGGSNNGGGGGGIILNNARPPVMEVVVTTVEQKTQSARLGLMKGDIIVSYRGKAITTRQQLGDLITRHARDAGQIELVVDRNGNLLDFQVVPGYLGIVTRMQAVR